MKFIKVNDWYVNLDLVTYIHVFSSDYVKVGYVNDYIELTKENAVAFIEAFQVKSVVILTTMISQV